MSQFRDRSEVGSYPTEYRAIVERYEGQTNQCTIFPADTEKHNRKTQWITAEAPAYIHLVDHR